MSISEKRLTRIELVDAVQALLAEGKENAMARERSAFDKLAGNSQRGLLLFGAGRLGLQTLAGLRRVGIEPLAFVDSNQDLWGKTIRGVSVLSPVEAARSYAGTATFVITIWSGHATDTMTDRERQLRNLGCRHVVPFTSLFWKYADGLLPHYALDLPHKVFEESKEVLAACDLWSDSSSRYEYLAQLRWRLLGDFDALTPPVKHPTYFPKDLYDLTCNEVFVDCGAYDGDTIKSFLRESGSRFDRIVAYEPDPASYSRLEASVATFPHPDRIRVQCAATGAQNGFVSFCASADESSYVSAGTGNLQVPCLTLDDSLRGIRPSYIKMDIEGAELDALKGARKVIEEHSPVLTVCSYHSQNHLWRIPLLINSFNKGYAFYLRPHLFEVWDLVCYAICSGASHKN